MKILVAGATGVVGRGVMEYCSENASAGLLGMARRRRGSIPGEFLSVDLLDAEACRQALADVEGVTHVVYAAVNEDQEGLVEGWRHPEHESRNLSMLRNLLSASEATDQPLEHVTLLQGGKAYGQHAVIPAKETTPRRLEPNFYYAQQDYLTHASVESDWSWTIFRPQLVFGFAVGSPLNILTTIASYAAISKELGVPLRFPGTNGSYIWQAIDTRLLAQAIVWAGSSSRARNQVFNVTNGDASNWDSLWIRFGELFDMEVGLPQPTDLSRTMPTKSDVWDTIVKKHELNPHSLEDVSAWQLADWVFNRSSNIYVSTIKLRQAGFHECVDTDEMCEDWLKALRNQRIIP